MGWGCVEGQVDSSFQGFERVERFASMHVFTRHVKMTFMNGFVGPDASAGGEEPGGALGEHSGGWLG